MAAPSLAACLSLPALRLHGAHAYIRAAARDFRAAFAQDLQKRFHVGDIRHIADDERVFRQESRRQNGQHGVFGGAHLHLARKPGRVMDQIRSHTAITHFVPPQFAVFPVLSMLIPSCRAHFDRMRRKP